MIAAELGVSLDALRRACPENPDDPLGLQPRKPHGPRGHAGDPFANVAPYVSPFAAAPPAEGGGLAVLFVLLILAG